MWKQTAVAAVAALGLAACGMPWEERGNGTKVTQERALTGFRQVANTTELDVHVLVGEAEHVEVTLDENLQDFVVVEIREDVLWVNTRAPLAYSGEGRVDVVLPRLVGATLSGSGLLEVEGRQQPQAVVVRHSGSGDMTLCTDAASLDIAHSGSGELKVCSPAGAAPLSLLKVEARGSGDVSWLGGAQKAELMHSGSGRLKLGGSGEELTLNQSGSGDVDTSAYSARVATLTSSSSGNVVASASERATVTLSGSGNIEVRGGGQVDIVSDTGSGDVLLR